MTTRTPLSEITNTTTARHRPPLPSPAAAAAGNAGAVLSRSCPSPAPSQAGFGINVVVRSSPQQRAPFVGVDVAARPAARPTAESPAIPPVVVPAGPPRRGIDCDVPAPAITAMRADAMAIAADQRSFTAPDLADHYTTAVMYPRTLPVCMPYPSWTPPSPVPLHGGMRTNCAEAPRLAGDPSVPAPFGRTSGSHASAQQCPLFPSRLQARVVPSLLILFRR